MAGEIQLNHVSLATESSGTVTINSSTDIKGCLNASGSAPIYACRAWINFDGTSASIGTGRASGNVSGVTDNGTGEYTVTFSTAMPDANYVAAMSCEPDSTGPTGDVRVSFVINYSTGSFEVITTAMRSAGAIRLDFPVISLAIFR